MYLVSPDYLKSITSNNSRTRLPPPPSPKMARKTLGQERNSTKQRWSVKNTKKKKDTVKRGYDRWVTARGTTRRVYDKWVKMQAKFHEADVERKRLIKTVAVFLKQVLPSSSTSNRDNKPDLDASHSGTQTELGPATQVKRYIISKPPAYKTTQIPSTSSDVIYETSNPPPPSIEKGDDDDVDPQVELHVLEYGATTLGELASPYVSTYLYESKRRFLDTDYGFRKVGDGFMIGDSRVSVDRDGNIHINH